MTNDGIYSNIGRRIAERRKQQGLSQNVLASRLSRRRTQAWLSTVESGQRQINAGDLYEISALLETSVGKLFSDQDGSSSSPIQSLNDLLSEVSGRLPIEMPVYLQRDFGKPNIAPVDYHYASAVPSRSVFRSAYPSVNSDAMSMMVVERYYRVPRMNPSDLLTYNVGMMPVATAEVRTPDRILISLVEPLAGFIVHPGIINSSGEAEISLSTKKTAVFSNDEFEILGVINVRRNLYPSSIIRTWLQRQYGITKDERLTEQLIERLTE
jgi:transcriptional regulator with XRE-family HTH domain